MITIWELDSLRKEVRPVSVEKWEIGGTLSWVDCVQPTGKDFETLSKKTGIPADDFKNSIDPLKRPHVLLHDEYSTIIFRAPCEEHGSVVNTPLGVFFFKRDIITIHHKRIKALDSFRALPRGELLVIFRKGAPYFVYRFMDTAISDFFDITAQLEANIDALEQRVLSDTPSNITKQIFLQKRVIIYSHKALVANRDVISSIEKHYLREFRKDDLRLFRDLYNDVSQLIDLFSTYREMLTSILDMYLSSVSNNLNKIVKALTAISAFIFIPTLIAGIYGMNFQPVSSYNMPELQWKYGYFFALGLMIISVCTVFVWFRRRKWI